MNQKKVAEKIVEESVVLLKNEDNVLPFVGQKDVAFFGRAQIGMLYSGNGSGGAHIAGCPTILDECEKNSIIPEALLKGFYTYKLKEEKVSEEDTFDWTKVNEAMNCGIMYLESTVLCLKNMKCQSICFNRQRKKQIPQ